MQHRQGTNGEVPITSTRGVRFVPDMNSDESSGNSLWDILLNIITACLASWCIFGTSLILALLYVTVRPFSKSSYRRLAAVWGGAAFVDAVTLLLPNCRIYLTGDSDLPSPVGSSVLVANHIVPADWWALFLLGRCVGLRGNLKVFLRNEFLQVNIEQRSDSTGSNGTSNIIRTNGSSSSLITAAASNGVFAIPHPGNNGSPSSFPGGHASIGETCRKAAPDLSLMAKLLHLFLEFPLINEDYASDREQLFSLLRSFASPDTGTPIHILFYPECWSVHSESDHKSVHAKSNEFAKREGKPTLKHLLLPRTRGFNASLECLRESSPVVYDVTMAYNGYDGSLPPAIELSMSSLWNILRRKFPREVHLRVKRYSMEEVMHDSKWLCKTWAEKDRLLSHFARHGQFPTDNRGYCRHRIFDTRSFSLESSIVSFIRLLLIPCAVPILLLLSVPLFWTILSMWLGLRLYRFIFRIPSEEERAYHNDDDLRPLHGTEQRTPGSASSTTGTPFFPATPFASPSILNWRDIFSPQQQQPPPVTPQSLSQNNNNGSRRTR